MGTKVSAGSKKTIVILASGEGSVAQALIDATTQPSGALYEHIELALIISENPEAGIFKRAEAANVRSQLIPFRSGGERSAWESELRAAVAAVKPWLVVSAGFMKILSPHFVSAFQIVNTHPALLPLFPGAHAVRDALAAGVTESGCTLHYIDEGVDTGEIIAQRRVEIIPGESETSLHSRIKELERELIVTGILGLALAERGK